MPNFPCMLPEAVALSSCGSVSVCRVLPGSWMLSCTQHALRSGQKVTVLSSANCESVVKAGRPGVCVDNDMPACVS